MQMPGHSKVMSPFVIRIVIFKLLKFEIEYNIEWNRKYVYCPTVGKLVFRQHHTSEKNAIERLRIRTET